MNTDDEPLADKRPDKKTLYLDVHAVRAAEFLKAQVPQAGLRFSHAALFRDMLTRLSAEPSSILAVERHAERGKERGRFISIVLTESDKSRVLALEAYYREHAKTRHRVRDSVPKARDLPLSRLYADFIRDQAVKLGWSPAA